MNREGKIKNGEVTEGYKQRNNYAEIGSRNCLRWFSELHTVGSQVSDSGILQHAPSIFMLSSTLRR